MSKTKILILSDFHFDDSLNFYKKHSEFSSVSNYIKFCIDEIARIHNAEKLDYIVLNGDIAFTGSAKDYTFFSDSFLKKLKIAIPNDFPFLLSVPGNHDISWSNIEYLYFNKAKDSNELYNKREVLFNSNAGILKKAFCDYTSFTKSVNINVFSNKNRFDSSIDESNLFGYVIDKQLKIIFFLINSAWFSLGAKINDLIIDHVPKNDIIESLKEALNIKDSLSEMGNQMVGQNLLRTLILTEKKFKNYDDYSTVVLMHHPLHWLNWNERYSIDLNQHNSKSLNQILFYSNFLITGHDHLPNNVDVDYLDKEVINLKSSCFLDELRENTYLADFKHLGFSVLTIFNNEKKKSFALSKYRIKIGTSASGSCLFSLESNQETGSFFSKIIVKPEAPLIKSVDSKRMFLLQMNPDFKRDQLVNASGINILYRSYEANGMQIISFYLFENDYLSNFKAGSIEAIDALLDKINAIINHASLVKKINKAEKLLFHIISFDVSNATNLKIYESVLENQAYTMPEKFSHRNSVFSNLKEEFEKWSSVVKHKFYMKIEPGYNGKASVSSKTIKIIKKSGLAFHYYPYWAK